MSSQETIFTFDESVPEEIKAEFVKFVREKGFVVKEIFNNLDQAILEVPKSKIRPKAFGVSVGVRVTAKVAIEILQSWGKQVNNEDEAYDVLGCGRATYGVKETQTRDPNRCAITLICEKEVHPPKFWLMRN